ncbi:Vps51/Vps67 family (components of vesiculartransport) protein, partial [Striga asiatica]
RETKETKYDNVSGSRQKYLINEASFEHLKTHLCKSIFANAEESNSLQTYAESSSAAAPKSAKTLRHPDLIFPDLDLIISEVVTLGKESIKNQGILLERRNPIYASVWTHFCCFALEQ